MSRLRLGDRHEAGAANQVGESASDVGRSTPLGAHRFAHSSGELVVTDINPEGRPVGVDERDAAARAHHPRHFGYGSKWVGEPLQSALGSHDVEGTVRFVERAGIANGEAHATLRRAGLRAGDAKHLGGHVDTNYLSVLAEILSEGESRLTETAADVEQPLSPTELQLFALPRPQPARRLPPGGGVHRGEQHSDVCIVIYPLVAEAMRVVWRHGPKATTSLGGRWPLAGGESRHSDCLRRGPDHARAMSGCDTSRCLVFNLMNVVPSLPPAEPRPVPQASVRPTVTGAHFSHQLEQLAQARAATEAKRVADDRRRRRRSVLNSLLVLLIVAGGAYLYFKYFDGDDSSSGEVVASAPAAFPVVTRAFEFKFPTEPKYESVPVQVEGLDLNGSVWSVVSDGVTLQVLAFTMSAPLNEPQVQGSFDEVLAGVIQRGNGQVASDRSFVSTEGVWRRSVVINASEATLFLESFAHGSTFAHVTFGVDGVSTALPVFVSVVDSFRFF